MASGSKIVVSDKHNVFDLHWCATVGKKIYCIKSSLSLFKAQCIEEVTVIDYRYFHVIRFQA